MSNEFDKQRVPEALRQFADIAEKWGATGSDSARYELADRALRNEAELAKLRTFASAWTNGHAAVYEEWLDREPITTCHEAAKFYFLLLLIDELSLFPERDPGDGVARCITALGRYGSESRASGRMWAAFSLPDYGDDARRALAALRAALNDEDLCVRAAAHHALAVLGDGDRKAHRCAIKKIIATSHDDDEGLVQMYARMALKWMDRSQPEREFQVFVGACITGDLRQLERLCTRVDVNAFEKDGSRPLGLAIGNDKSRVAAFLLQHGADPNLPLRRGSRESALHAAAIRIDGAEIIRLLAAHGAKLNALDGGGHTPLDMAVESDRKGNAELLRELGALESRSLRNRKDWSGIAPKPWWYFW